MHLPHTGSFLLPGGQLENKPVIGISASETSVSYRLLCRALSIKFKVCDHKGYDTSVPYRTVEFRSFGNFEKNPHQPLTELHMSAPGIRLLPLATFSHLLLLNREEVCGTEDWLSKALPTVPWTESKFTAATTNDQHTTMLHGVQA